ncbi:hypothetical protein PVAND_016471 [Polypedilum vanderplanki]|uniref:Uncharacterized protein n=1 Tax=Polypedilum vanderplanki TaxID=319348 RepID=A0A9J6BFI8_POLVA|nr:hypothetical protein PVAND_016471 [Polypedilum vanderplanki]
MKIKIILFLIFLFFQINAKFNIRIIKFNCISSNKTAINTKCYTRAFNRRSPVFNIETKKIRNFEHLKLDLVVFHKLHIDDSHKMILDLEKIEICKLLEGSSSSAFLKSFIAWLSSLFPKTGICTILGQINFNNISIPESAFMQMFPTGRYLAVFSYFDDVDKNILQINVTVVLTK